MWCLVSLTHHSPEPSHTSIHLTNWLLTSSLLTCHSHSAAALRRNLKWSKMTPTVDEFLQQCKQSGDAAYATFRSLLERLDHPETRSQARIFLSHLQKRFPSKDSCDQCFQTYHFRIEDILLDQFEGISMLSFVCPFFFLSLTMINEWNVDSLSHSLNRSLDLDVDIITDKTNFAVTGTGKDKICWFFFLSSPLPPQALSISIVAFKFLRWFFPHV